MLNSSELLQCCAHCWATQYMNEVQALERVEISKNAPRINTVSILGCDSSLGLNRDDVVSMKR